MAEKLEKRTKTAVKRLAGAKRAIRLPRTTPITIFFLKIRRPPRSTRRLTRFPYATLFRPAPARRFLGGVVRPLPADRAAVRRSGRGADRKSTRLNPSHQSTARMPSSARKKKKGNTNKQTRSRNVAEQIQRKNKS